jgi:hypothetical protein
MPNEPSQVFDPLRGDYHEQEEGGFAVLEVVRGDGVKYLVIKPTEAEAKQVARERVQNRQADDAFVVPVKFACSFKQPWTIE